MSKLFPISIEVEQDAVGRVMLLLNKTPGVAKFHLDMDRVQKTNGTGQPRGPYKRGNFEVSGEDTVLKVLFGKPPMTAQQLRDVFISQGRSGSSINSVLYKFKRDGDVQVNDDGYALTKKARDRLRHRKAKR